MEVPEPARHVAGESEQRLERDRAPAPEVLVQIAVLHVLLNQEQWLGLEADLRTKNGRENVKISTISASFKRKQEKAAPRTWICPRRSSSKWSKWSKMVDIEPGSDVPRAARPRFCAGAASSACLKSPERAGHDAGRVSHPDSKRQSRAPVGMGIT